MSTECETNSATQLSAYYATNVSSLVIPNVAAFLATNVAAKLLAQLSSFSSPYPSAHKTTLETADHATNCWAFPDAIISTLEFSH